MSISFFQNVMMGHLNADESMAHYCGGLAVACWLYTSGEVV
ncbi:MAG: hypothetical protein WBK51_07615 [Polaromonas sp.]